MDADRRSGQERRVDGRVGGRRIDDDPALYDHYQRVLVAVSEQLYHRMDAEGLTQAAVAQRADLHPDTLMRMLQTRTNFDVSSLVRAAHALEAEVLITLVPRRADHAYKRADSGHVPVP